MTEPVAWRYSAACIIRREPYRCLIGGGHDNIYKNNIFVDVPQAFHIDNRMEGWSKATMDKGGIFEQRLNTVHYDQPPYVTAYPLLAGYWKIIPVCRVATKSVVICFFR